MRYDRPRYVGVIAGLFGVILTWLCSQYNMFEVADYIFHDIYLRYTLNTNKSSKYILLIHMKKDIPKNHNWIQFLENIEKHNPKQIIFTSWPKHATRQFYQLAIRYKNVIFGRHLQRQIESRDHIHLETLPKAIADLPIPFGIVATPPARFGVHRSQYAFFKLKGKSYPALEMLALEQHLGHVVQRPARRYRLNFKGGTARLPMVDLNRVLTDGGVPELIEGRHVLIGSHQSDMAPGLYTPLSPHLAKVSALEYHGLALDTLLSGRTILEFQKPILLGLMLILLTINLFLYQWLNMRLASWLTLGLMMLYTLAGWLFFSYTLRWLPVPEMLIVQVGTFLLVFREKAVVRERLLRKMLLDTSAQMQERMAPPNFLTSREHWSQVVGMLCQMLDLSRLILLERVNSDHRIKATIAWQCEFEDIYERRRDFHRPPYSIAIRERKLLQLTQRPFLRTTTASENQYLMPLMFAGEVYGFWAFGIEPDKMAQIPQFDAVIEEFGNQISALLYRRQQWTRRSQVEYRQNIERYLQLEGGDKTCLNLAKSVALMTQRLGRLENVFSHLSVATIVYNLFGNVMHVNKRMEELMQTAQLTPYGMNLLDLMVALCHVDQSEARELLRRIVFEKTHLPLPATLPNSPDNHYILHLHPIVQNDADSLNQPDDVQPFHMTGILSELVDVTDIQQMHHFKIQIMEKIKNQTQKDLISFTKSFHNIAKRHHLPPFVNEELNAIKLTIDNLIPALDYLYKILDIDVDHQRRGIYPVNIPEIMASSINRFDLPVNRNIRIVTAFSGDNELGFASPSKLEYAIHAILDLLFSDAIDNSQIHVDIQDDMSEITCFFSNIGFGMPNARLQDYLFGSHDIDSERFLKLRQTMQEVRRWAATLEATSEMGVGIRFCLRLKAFI